MIPRRHILLIALLLPTMVAAARAQNGSTGFQTPSKNIACQFFAIDGRGSLRCDIGETTTRPPRPADCPLDWGHAFEMYVKGNASLVCAGDTVADPTLPMLGYGEVWQYAGFTCRSDQTGVTCFNATQHGFSLSRAEQKLF
jgi:hypothetical protein